MIELKRDCMSRKKQEDSGRGTVFSKRTKLFFFFFLKKKKCIMRRQLSTYILTSVSGVEGLAASYTHGLLFSSLLFQTIIY
jgi:hypothetical protein